MYHLDNDYPIPSAPERISSTVMTSDDVEIRLTRAIMSGWVPVYFDSMVRYPSRQRLSPGRDCADTPTIEQPSCVSTTYI